jgi:uncharacterized protein DUF4262
VSPPKSVDFKFVWPESESPAHDRLLGDVQEYGCHILNVAGEGRADFSYSVGLYLNFGHPEIVVIGLSADKAMQLINLVCDRVAQGGQFDEGSLSMDLLNGLPVAFMKVEPEHYDDRFGFANWFYQSLPTAGFPVLQLVWPDREGRFPWDTQFDQSPRSMQPVLCRIA